jgi:hypothetical protein
MTIRLVSKQQARSAADAELFVLRDTGGAVVPTGNTTAIGDGPTSGWKIEVFSMDGLSAPPAAVGRTVFSVISINESSQTATLRDHTGFDFVVSRTLPELLGTTVTLQIGQHVSGVLLGPSIVEDLAIVTDVLVEDNLKERKEFASVPSDVRGWEPRNFPSKDAGKM